MEILCSSCEKNYEECDQESILLYQNGCKMICNSCSNKNYENMGWKIQPERSKREDMRKHDAVL